MLGVAAIQTGRLEIGVGLIDDAIALNPSDAEAHNNRGTALKDLKRLDEALASYDKALALKPDYAEVHNNRGNALLKLGRLDEAMASYDRALALKPHYARAHNNRGTALLRLDRPDAALASYNEALRLKPDFAEAFSNQGTALCHLARLDEALASCDKALALKPDYAEAHNIRGTALLALKRLEEALASYDKALALKSDFAEAYVNRGNTYRHMVNLHAARNDYEQALRINPDYHLAKWHLTFAAMPVLFRSEREAETSRICFSRALEDLDEWFDSSRLNGAEESVAASQPFHLAYQEENNKELLFRYGRLCRRLMEDWQSGNAVEMKDRTFGEKTRIGLVSGHLYDHPVWSALVKGWLLNFDSNQFEWHVFSLGDPSDKETDIARRSASSFTERKSSLKAWASSILDRAVDVLIYPEIGMHQLTTQLASLRLAPIQIAAWGHPETTGLPTIDYYLSADLLEPDEAHLNYTEALVKLPNLGCTYSPHQSARSELDIAKLGIRDDIPILLCPGTLHKYLPKYDAIFPRIARRLGQCTFVFFDQQPYWTTLLKSRLRMAFENDSLVLDDYIRFIPWLTRKDFYGLMQRADVFLDTIGFSGFNTAMQAIECSLPVVSMEGRFMRGRLASGILKRLGLDHLIGTSQESYCNIVERLVKDEAYRASVVSAIDARRAILYDDMEPLRALEQFLVNRLCPPGKPSV